MLKLISHSQRHQNDELWIDFFLIMWFHFRRAEGHAVYHCIILLLELIFRGNIIVRTAAYVQVFIHAYSKVALKWALWIRKTS